MPQTGSPLSGRPYPLRRQIISRAKELEMDIRFVHAPRFQQLPGMFKHQRRATQLEVGVALAQQLIEQCRIQKTFTIIVSLMTITP